MPPRLRALAVLLVAACGGAPAPERRDAGRMGSVVLLRPARPPRDLVFLFTDAGGWSAAWERAGAALRERGAAVVGVDLPGYLAGLDASDEACHYVVSEIEELSKRLQQDLGSEAYRSPILAGAGAGATLAYAALAQAPPATLAGAAGVDPAPALVTKAPLCPGAPARPAPGGGFAYGGAAALPGFHRVETAAVAPDAAPARVAALVAAARASEEPATLEGLPLVELPAAAPGSFLAVIWSGDGGWRDLDKTLGELLSRSGVGVVGVDSLRYFWRPKTPERVAADLAAILRHYGVRWDRQRYAIVGYSFGAGIVPFAVNRLPPELRARVVQITLLGPGERAPFAFRVGGWLEQIGVDVSAYRDAPLVLPELARVDPRLVQCVYGEEETDSLCKASELAAAEIIRTPGGHHFDGDYAALARRIREGLERRSAERGRASP